MKIVKKAVAALMLMTVTLLYTQCNNAPTQTPQENTNTAAPTKVKQTKGMIDGHEYVDLDLPSGTLWATCNMGANKPEDYGYYYAWGETSVKSTYNMNTYIYGNDYDKLTKYCNKTEAGDNGFVDNLTTLQASDDPATSLGNGWHMPSDSQWNELQQYTIGEWTTCNGVAGMLFTAKNGEQTLFLPAAGEHWDNEFRLVGSNGIYSSNALYTDNPNHLWSFLFGPDGSIVTYYYRATGIPVRPVHSSK